MEIYIRGLGLILRAEKSDEQVELLELEKSGIRPAHDITDHRHKVK